MNVVNVDFPELYLRHLCRHSQFGINVQHLIGVAVTYICLYGLAFWAFGSLWPLLALTAVYVIVLAFNIPFPLLLINTLVIGLFFAAFLALPPTPVWVYLIVILVFHRLQVWSHKVYDKSHDMTVFNEKYKKGFQLFLLLSIYELPILLNYLVFDRRSWTS